MLGKKTAHLRGKCQIVPTVLAAASDNSHRAQVQGLRQRRAHFADASSTEKWVLRDPPPEAKRPSVEQPETTVWLHATVDLQEMTG